MTEDTMRAWAEIDTKALIHNLELAKSLTGKRIMCVIKGDAPHPTRRMRCFGGKAA